MQSLSENIRLNVYIRNEEMSQINNLSFYFTKLEKEEQIKYTVNRRKNNKDQGRNQWNKKEENNTENLSKGWLFQINKRDWTLAGLVRKRKKTQKFSV